MGKSRRPRQMRRSLMRLFSGRWGGGRRARRGILIWKTPVLATETDLASSYRRTRTPQVSSAQAECMKSLTTQPTRTLDLNRKQLNLNLHSLPLLQLKPRPLTPNRTPPVIAAHPGPGPPSFPPALPPYILLHLIPQPPHPPHPLSSAPPSYTTTLRLSPCSLKSSNPKQHHHRRRILGRLLWPVPSLLFPEVTLFVLG